MGHSLVVAAVATPWALEDAFPLVTIELAVIGAITALALIFLLFNIAFGELRLIERQRTYDRLLNFMLFKIVCIGAIQPLALKLFLWTSYFGVLGFFRILSSLCRDRFDHVSTTPNTPLSAYITQCFLLLSILGLDVAWIYLCCIAVGTTDLSLLFLLTCECLLIMMATLHTLLKYAGHFYDMLCGMRWSKRIAFLYYVDFYTDVGTHLVTLGHYAHIILVHEFVFSFIEVILFLNTRSVVLDLRRRIDAHMKYLHASSKLQQSASDASDEELKLYDDPCAICREHMLNASKRLGCGHMFHSHCLERWLEHQATCPTCRFSLTVERHIPEPTHAVETTRHGFHFPGQRLASWLPSFSVEIVQHREGAGLLPTPPRELNEMTQIAREIFPNLATETVFTEIARTGDLQASVDTFLGLSTIHEQTEPVPTSITDDHTQSGPDSEWFQMLQLRKRALLETGRKRYFNKR